MAKTLEPRLGFTIRIEPCPGLPPALHAAFERRLEKYLAERELQMNGGPLCALIWSGERSLTATDQVDLLNWLVSQPLVRSVILSPLDRRLDRMADRDAGAIRVDILDTTLIALSLLYRTRRIGAELYLQILGGFVRPAIGH